MADKQKICIVYAPGLKESLEPVIKEVADQGSEVRIHGASEKEVIAARGDVSALSTELLASLEDASLCVLLINQKGQFDAVAAYAAELRIRVIVIMIGMDACPTGAADEIAGSCVTIGSSKLGDALRGHEIWEEPDGTPKRPRDVRRQKCQ